MNKKTKYSELLRDPKWQKMRLKVMERDDYRCQICFDAESTLNVHHCYYAYGKKPWEYPESSLLTLCESCHEKETETLKAAKDDLITILSQKGFTSSAYMELAQGFVNCDCCHPAFISAISWALGSYEGNELVMRAYFDSIKSPREAK